MSSNRRSKPLRSGWFTPRGGGPGGGGDNLSGVVGGNGSVAGTTSCSDSIYSDANKSVSDNGINASYLPSPAKKRIGALKVNPVKRTSSGVLGDTKSVQDSVEASKHVELNELVRGPSVNGLPNWETPLTPKNHAKPSILQRSLNELAVDDLGSNVDCCVSVHESFHASLTIDDLEDDDESMLKAVFRGYHQAKREKTLITMDQRKNLWPQKPQCQGHAGSEVLASSQQRPSRKDWHTVAEPNEEEEILQMVLQRSLEDSGLFSTMDVPATLQSPLQSPSLSSFEAARMRFVNATSPRVLRARSQLELIDECSPSCKNNSWAKAPPSPRSALACVPRLYEDPNRLPCQEEMESCSSSSIGFDDAAEGQALGMTDEELSKRLAVIEQEREMLELAMERSLHESSFHNSSASSIISHADNVSFDGRSVSSRNSNTVVSNDNRSLKSTDRNRLTEQKDAMRADSNFLLLDEDSDSEQEEDLLGTRHQLLHPCSSLPNAARTSQYQEQSSYSTLPQVTGHQAMARCSPSRKRNNTLGNFDMGRNLCALSRSASLTANGRPVTPADNRIANLERLEQKMLEEALQRSLNDIHR